MVFGGLFSADGPWMAGVRVSVFLERIMRICAEGRGVRHLGPWAAVQGIGSGLHVIDGGGSFGSRG